MTMPVVLTRRSLSAWAPIIGTLPNSRSLLQVFVSGVGALMLLASPISVAAPVSVSFERMAYRWGAGPGWDNDVCTSGGPIAAVGSYLSIEYCARPNPYEITYHEGVYDPRTGEYSYDIGPTSTVGWHYASEALSADNSFSLLASNLVYAADTFPLVDPELESWSAGSHIMTFFYWTEFVVTEDVLYTGSHALTDGQLLNGGCSPYLHVDNHDRQYCYNEQLTYSSSGNTYAHGSILSAGTYQYWNLGDFEQLYLRADHGQTLTASAQENYAFTFTAVVPIPAAVWLFGSALLGLGLFKRASA